MKKNTQVSFFMVAVMMLFLTCENDKQEKENVASLNLTVNDASGYNTPDGSIDLSLEDASPPYFYQWSNGDTTQNLKEIHAGEYTVTVLYGESFANYLQSSAEVSQPPPAPLNIEAAIVDVVTYDHREGEIDVSVTGGTPPYSYTWSTGDTLARIQDLLAGTYSVTVTDNSIPYPIETIKEFIVNQPEFVCGRDSIRDIEGNLYATVKINDQCWFQENLKTTRNPNYPDSVVQIKGVHCYKNYCSSTEGAHYSFDAMMNGESVPEDSSKDVQGICPEGWHLPNESDFNELKAFLIVDGNGGSGTFAGRKLRGPESSSGFNALLIGNWGYGVYNKADQASFWITKEYKLTENSPEAEHGYARYVTEDAPFLNGGHYPKEYGLSVRCIKNVD